MKAKIDKLVMLADEVTSKKDIARTSMRLQALSAQLNYELLEELRKERLENRRAEAAQQSHDAKTSATARAERDELKQEWAQAATAQAEQNAAILGALAKIVDAVQPRASSRRRKPTTRAAGRKSRRAA